MTDRSTREGTMDSSGDAATVADRPEPDGVACTEAYEQDGVVVLYDAENPLAWIEAETAVTVERMA